MDQRMFLAAMLSIAVIFGYYLFFPPSPPRPPKPQPPASQSGVAIQDEPGDRQSAGTMGGTPAATQPDAPPRAAPVKVRQVKVDTPRYTALFDTRGARLISLKLKQYKMGKDYINWGDIVPPLGKYLKKPQFDPTATMEMVKDKLSRVDPLDVVFVENQALTGEFRRVGFSTDVEEVKIFSEAAQPGRIVFTGSAKNGLTLRKILTFQPDSYTINYEIQVINYGKDPLLLTVLNLFGEGPDPGSDGDNVRSFYGPIFREDGSVDTESADGIEEKLIVRDPQWLGITANYFLTAAAPESRIDHGMFRVAKPSGAREDDEPIAYYGFELPVVRLSPGNMISGGARLYFGPKQVDELTRFGNGLEESIQQTFDWLGPLADILLAILHWFNGYTGNYGLAIILLTVVVRVGLFPLTYRGMVSMKRMSKLQPRVKVLREKYKDNKERMNKEMMDMYKRHKVNPLGGCLPILVQLPIFFALYSALLSAIELRHASFVGWITDLSAMDPLYITPLLMGATMFLQQRLTPTTMDPTQQRILMWMPVIFMVFMFSFPAGLVLYWLTSNTLSILQQLIINRVHIPEPVEKEG
ncbi:MAG: membrane protein insertase YidC [SAR324 cluster bacterium]|nr:membrane protein insertase YidC [SAR324 cluster bacterium]